MIVWLSSKCQFHHLHFLQFNPNVVYQHQILLLTGQYLTRQPKCIVGYFDKLTTCSCQYNRFQHCKFISQKTKVGIQIHTRVLNLDILKSVSHYYIIYEVISRTFNDQIHKIYLLQKVTWYNFLKRRPRRSKENNKIDYITI
jgi:hypothetical protein